MWLCSVLVFVLYLYPGICVYHNRPRSSQTALYRTYVQDQITVPVIIHFDKALTDRFEHDNTTKAQIKRLTKNIFKGVETYFAHPSLNQSVRFVIKDVKFLKKSTVNMDENASKYLKSYCSWQSMRKFKTSKWWYSVLLTGLDVYYINNKGTKVLKSSGRGYMRGVCTKHKSCTLLEWNSKHIGYLLAHEIGHSLGMSHDGPPNNACRPNQTIMTSKYQLQNMPRSWSPCSKLYLQKFLESKNSWCLR